MSPLGAMRAHQSEPCAVPLTWCNECPWCGVRWRDEDGGPCCGCDDAEADNDCDVGTDESENA